MRTRVSRLCAAVFLGLVLLMPLASVSAANVASSYTFTSFDYPGAIVTQAYGINPGGDIVGTYQGATDIPSTVWPGTKQSHGFLLKGGEFSTFDYPSAAGRVTDCTIPTGISPDGDITGYYGVVGQGLTNAWGFIFSKHSEWSTLPNQVDPALGDPTMKPSPFRILPDGRTVG